MPTASYKNWSDNLIQMGLYQTVLEIMQYFYTLKNEDLMIIS